MNGAIAMNGVGHINITAKAPVLAPNSANQTLGNSAVVNPSQAINERINMMAKRILAQKGSSPSAQIDQAYRIAVGRLPTESEKADVTLYLGEYRKSLEEANRVFARK